MSDEWVTTDEPCPSGHTDCTVDCGSCKGTGYHVIGRRDAQCPYRWHDVVRHGCVGHARGVAEHRCACGAIRTLAKRRNTSANPVAEDSND